MSCQLYLCPCEAIIKAEVSPQRAVSFELTTNTLLFRDAPYLGSQQQI
jgi:hypothetical protein